MDNDKWSRLFFGKNPVGPGPEKTLFAHLAHQANDRPPPLAYILAL